jgi:hypothetical protein
MRRWGKEADRRTAAQGGWPAKRVKRRGPSGKSTTEGFWRASITSSRMCVLQPVCPSNCPVTLRAN